MPHPRALRAPSRPCTALEGENLSLSSQKRDAELRENQGAPHKGCPRDGARGQREAVAPEATASRPEADQSHPRGWAPVPLC